MNIYVRLSLGCDLHVFCVCQVERGKHTHTLLFCCQPQHLLIIFTPLIRRVLMVSFHRPPSATDLPVPAGLGRCSSARCTETVHVLLRRAEPAAGSRKVITSRVVSNWISDA